MSDGSFTEGVFSGKAEEPPKYPFAHQDYMAQPAAELSEFSEQIESTQMPSQYPDYMTQNAGYHQPNLADYDRAKAVAQQPQQGMHGYVPYPGQNSGQNIQYGQPQNFSQYRIKFFSLWKWTTILMNQYRMGKEINLWILIPTSQKDINLIKNQNINLINAMTV